MQPTEVIPSELYNLPLSFGLMMSGFSGHAVFPAIYRDMENPKHYETMVNLTYVITVGVYITMAIAGYMMFGLETMQEVREEKRVNVCIMSIHNKHGYSDHSEFSCNTWILEMGKPSGYLAHCIDAHCKVWFDDEPCVFDVRAVDNRLCQGGGVVQVS